MTAERQDGDPASMLSLYRAALALRVTHPGLAGGAFRWIAAPDGVLAFERDAGFACLVNVSGGPLPLPAGSAVILRSDTGMAAGDPLSPDAAAWIMLSPRPR
jgi:alpha-glucosidase